MMELIVELDGLMNIEGVEGVSLYNTEDDCIKENEEGKLFLHHAGGKLEVPVSSSMMATAKKYRDGTKLKIKGREFVITHSILHFSKKGRWKLKACINPSEQKGGCHCEVIVPFEFI
ncbi:hypothetical protein [Bacillus massiliigorillae]|uniref:hypothetical protein n=1 Tax=Bacillus massiliigorillae TaxID=1243664 RepID=UPI0003A0501F|nr:hypothetical protein [Bacillus massiliigorillae]